MGDQLIWQLMQCKWVEGSWGQLPGVTRNEGPSRALDGAKHDWKGDPDPGFGDATAKTPALPWAGLILVNACTTPHIKIFKNTSSRH